MKVDLIEAIKILQRGEIVIIPTETVYGVAALYDNDQAIQKLYTLKSRPYNKPCTLHLHSKEQIPPFISEYPANAKEIIEDCCPGPYTFILPAHVPATSPLLRGGKPTIGIRIPAHETTQALLKATGPLVASSANLSSHPPLNTLYDIEAVWGQKLPILTEGEPPHGVSSTIIEHTEKGWKCIRQGKETHFFHLQSLYNVFS